MTADELKAYQKKEPFKPFRLVLNDGKSYDIPHPDFLWVLTKAVHVATHGDVVEGLWERYEIVDLAQINGVEPLPQNTLPQTNVAS